MNTLATPRRIRRHRRFGAVIALAAVATVGIADATSSFAVAQEGSASHTTTADSSQHAEANGFPVLMPESVLPLGTLDLLDSVLADPTTTLTLPQGLLDRLADDPLVDDLLGSEDDGADGTGDTAEDDAEGDTDPDPDGGTDDGTDPAPTAPAPDLPQALPLPGPGAVDELVGALPTPAICPESDDSTADTTTDDASDQDPEARPRPIASTLETLGATATEVCDLLPAEADEDPEPDAPAEEPTTTATLPPVPAAPVAPAAPVTTAVTTVTTAIVPAAPAPAPAPLTITEPKEGLL